MVNDIQTIVHQQGAVSCWTIHEEQEMAFHWVKRQVNVLESGVGKIRLELQGYHSEWRNRHYDKPNRTAVQLKVLRIQGNSRRFIYTALRTVGTSNGDGAAARGQEPEWFEIHVVRSPDPKDSRREKITASWKRVPQPI